MELKRFIKIYHVNHDTENGRIRIEITKGMPLELLGIQMPCVACGETIHPVRKRHGKPKRGRDIGRLYIAVTCELSENVGCSRSAEARDEYCRIKDDIETT